MSSAAAPIQFSYRFATPITGGAHEAWTLVGTVDTSFEITIDTDYALIVKVGNSGDMNATGDYQLQYDVDGGGFNDVNATSSNVRSVASGDADDATSTTERLTTSARTFDVSTLDEVDGLNVYNVQGGMDVEFYFTLNFRSAELSGGETVTFRLLSGGSTFDSLGAGSYDITPTATVPVLAKTASGTPSIETITASGVSTIFKTASGTATLVAVAAAGVAALAGVLTSSGTPSIDTVTASGSAKIIKTASGTPSIETVTASGVATIVKRSTGTPSIDTVVASGTAILAPRVHLNTTQTLSGATLMTRTAYNVAGTSATFTDPTGPPIGALFLGVENRNLGGGDSNTGWIAVTVGASRQANGTPSIETITASGVATLTGALTASGTPAIDSPVASGIATIFKRASGTPAIDTIIAAGTVVQTLKPSGTPSIDSPIASGVATIFKPASGTPSIETIIASGVASLAGEITSTGTPSIDVITASGAAKIIKTASGTPSIETVIASGIARFAHDASGTPSIDTVVAAGSAKIIKPASGTPSIETITASGTATAAEVLTASGTPSIEVITANGLVNLFGGTEGFPTLEVITASGVARFAHDASGTPSIDEIVASGTVTQTLKPSGTPSIDEITAAGVADATPTVISAAITGDLALTETDVRAGGKQTIITLTADTWQASGAAFNQVRQIIRNGVTSAQSELTGWNNEVRDKTPITSVVRTSDTVVTITWSAAPDYDVLADEVITVTVPAAALVTSTSEVVAIPTIDVTADIDTIKVHDIRFSSVSRSMSFSCESRSMDFSSASRSMGFNDKLTPDSFILLEDGGKLLLEDGFALLKESE